MPNKNLEYSSGTFYLFLKGREIDGNAVIWDVIRSTNKWMLQAERETAGDRQHMDRTTPEPDVCSNLSGCADGETMSPNLMGS